MERYCREIRMREEQIFSILENALKDSWKYSIDGEEKINRETFRLNNREEIHEIDIRRLIPAHDETTLPSEKSDMTIGWRIHYNYFNTL